jgi:hypothetical protein
MGDAIGERICLTGARTCDNEEWRRFVQRVASVLHRAPLIVIELGEVGRSSHGGLPFTSRGAGTPVEDKALILSPKSCIAPNPSI